MSPSIDRIIEHDIDTLNNHLPESRVTLRELIAQQIPKFLTRCGEESVFRIEDILFLKQEVPEVYHNDIRLPIVILRRLDYDSGIFTVAGNKTELFMIHKILGYDDLSWEEFSTWRPIERLARPQVQLLRRKMPSTTIIGIVFATTKEKARIDESIS